MAILKDIAAIAKGMSITFGEMFKPTQVENYPDGKGPLRGAVFQERFRGVHVLQRDENGLEKCVACFLCAAACPSNCTNLIGRQPGRKLATMVRAIIWVVSCSPGGSDCTVW